MTAVRLSHDGGLEVSRAQLVSQLFVFFNLSNSVFIPVAKNMYLILKLVLFVCLFVCVCCSVHNVNRCTDSVTCCVLPYARLWL